MLSGFLNDLQLWTLNCLLHDLHLWSFHGLLDHVHLSLRNNGHVRNLIQEQCNLDVLGYLVDLLLDDGFLHCLLDDFMPLHFGCIDNVLNVRVHALLRLSLRLNHKYLNDLLSERNSRGFDGLLHRTLLNPVPRENLGGLRQFLHKLRNWGVNDLLQSPLLDSVLGNSPGHFGNLPDNL